MQCENGVWQKAHASLREYFVWFKPWRCMGNGVQLNRWDRRILQFIRKVNKFNVRKDDVKWDKNQNIASHMWVCSKKDKDKQYVWRMKIENENIRQ